MAEPGGAPRQTKCSPIPEYGRRAALYNKWRNQLQTGRGNKIPGPIKWLPLLTLWGENWRMEENGEKTPPRRRRQNIIDFDFKVEKAAYFITYFNSKVAGKYILLSIEYILLFRLNIYVRYSFTCSFSTFYIGLLFTHSVA